MRLLWNDTVAMGDTLCTFPAMVKMIERDHFDTVGFTNDDVGALFPLEKYGCASLYQRPDGPQWGDQIHVISLHKMVLEGAHMKARFCHPSTAFIAHMGFPELSDEPLRPEIEFDRDADVPVYDFIISPYILADADRMWPLSSWQVVIDHLRRQFVNASIAVIGTSKLPSDADLKKLNPYDQRHFYDNARTWQRSLTGVTYEFDRPLFEIAAMMAKCRRAIITVDSGPSRLAHAVEPEVPHIIIAHNSVPIEWAGYSGAYMLHADLRRLGPVDVLSAVVTRTMAGKC